MVLWGMSRDLFGQYLMSVGKHEKARVQFKQAYDVSLEINGETDEQTLVLLNSLGTKNDGNVYLNKYIIIVLVYVLIWIQLTCSRFLFDHRYNICDNGRRQRRRKVFSRPYLQST